MIEGALSHLLYGEGSLQNPRTLPGGIKKTTSVKSQRVLLHRGVAANNENRPGRGEGGNPRRLMKKTKIRPAKLKESPSQGKANLGTQARILGGKKTR